jgi:hypothetical protein
MLFVCMLVLPVLLQAQSDFTDDTEDNPVPIDGGVSILVAAAIGYGLKKADIKGRTRGTSFYTENGNN